MKSAIEVRFVMSPAPFTISTVQTLADAKDKMSEHNIRHLPVRHGGKLVGVISDRDIYFAIGVDKVEASEIKVGDAYTGDPYVVSPDTDLADVARHMSIEKIGCAIVAKKENIVGIVTTVDACRVLSEVLSGNLEQDGYLS